MSTCMLKFLALHWLKCNLLHVKVHKLREQIQIIKGLSNIIFNWQHWKATKSIYPVSSMTLDKFLLVSVEKTAVHSTQRWLELLTRFTKLLTDLEAPPAVYYWGHSARHQLATQCSVEEWLPASSIHRKLIDHQCHFHRYLYHYLSWKALVSNSDDVCSTWQL